MSTAALDLGSLNDQLGNANPSENLVRSIDGDADYREQHPEVVQAILNAVPTGKINMLRSAGPISDAYIVGHDPIAVLCGPRGSGKSVADDKKAAVEAQRVHPGADGVRRYVLGVYRQKYDSLWKATIPSWWWMFPKDLPGSQWTGASPRAATHRITFQDQWGPIILTAHFLAFGEGADPEDLRGLQFMDILLPEMDTLPRELLTALIPTLGRDPPPEITGRQGKIFGSMNAPDVLNWTYSPFFEKPAKGYKLYRQPSGLAPDAENLQSYATTEDPSGRGYYTRMVELYADQPHMIRRMVHGIPGVTRATDLVYDKFDETTMLSQTTLVPEPALPVIVGVDGGLTPAAVYMQEMPDGQLRVYAEIALERGGMEELARAMLALEARRFPRCEFRTVCDPAMKAGEDTDRVEPVFSDSEPRFDQRVSRGSDRQRLARAIGRKVDLAATQEVGRRWDAVRVKISLALGPGRPGYLLDPSCLGLRRGKLQTYQFRKLRGTNDLSSVQPSFDTHVADAEQYGALECGTDRARKRQSDLVEAQRARQQQNKTASRYSPLNRWRRR